MRFVLRNSSRPMSGVRLLEDIETHAVRCDAFPRSCCFVVVRRPDELKKITRRKNVHESEETSLIR